MPIDRFDDVTSFFDLKPLKSKYLVFGLIFFFKLLNSS